MNVDRMRRYIARTTPDEIQTRFDRIDDNATYKVNLWLEKFKNRMEIKHKGSVRITIYMDEETAFRTHETVVIARVEPRRNNGVCEIRSY